MSSLLITAGLPLAALVSLVCGLFIGSWVYKDVYTRLERKPGTHAYQCSRRARGWTTTYIVGQSAGTIAGITLAAVGVIGPVFGFVLILALVNGVSLFLLTGSPLFRFIARVGKSIIEGGSRAGERTAELSQPPIKESSSI